MQIGNRVNFYSAYFVTNLNRAECASMGGEE